MSHTINPQRARLKSAQGRAWNCGARKQRDCRHQRTPLLARCHLSFHARTCAWHESQTRGRGRRLYSTQARHGAGSPFCLCFACYLYSSLICALLRERGAVALRVAVLSGCNARIKHGSNLNFYARALFPAAAAKYPET